ncbi:hypothetical protein OROMI_024947 [Orobanche minor]
MARIMFFKIRPSQEILKIRDATPLEVEGILTYIKSPRNGSICYFSSKPSQVILKNRDGTTLEEMPSQEILKIRDGTPLEMQSQEILKIRDATPLEAEGILTYIKSPRNGSICYFSSKLDVPSNLYRRKEWPSQVILKNRDGTPLEAEGILTYIKSLQNGLAISRNFKIRDGTPFEAEEMLTYIKEHSKQIEILKIRDGTPLEKRVARIMFFKIRPSQEILKIRDGTPLEAEGILTYIKSPRNGSICYFSSKLDVPSNAVHNKRVARILFFKIRQSQEILKIRDATPLEAEGILTYIKSPRNGSICYFSSKPSQEILKIHRPSQEILKIRDGTPLEKRVARIMFFKIRPFKEILKIRDGTPLEAEGILTYIKSPRNGSICYFSSKLNVPSNAVHNKRVARILFFKIRQSQEILKIRDGTPLEAEGILTYIKSPRNGSICYFSSKLDVPSNVVQKKRVAQLHFFKIRPSQEILKIRDATPLEAEGILTYIKSPRNGSICYFSSKLDVPSNYKLDFPSNIVQKKRVARIMFFQIRPSQEILKIRDGTPLEAEGILTYIKSPRNGSIYYFSSKLDVPSNVVHNKRVAQILFFTIRASQEILKIRDGTPLEAEGIVTYIKSPRNRSICYFSSKLDVPSNVLQNKRVARILSFKIRPSQEILKIRDATSLEAEGILTYIKALETDRFVTFLSS